uniref:Major facilitator superfamily (MFS) profile domain-containing protein n=1 Tax=Octopus bimaculoides TaxID=37653 RepID=A0A0L8FMC0_OCTBM
MDNDEENVKEPGENVYLTAKAPEGDVSLSHSIQNLTKSVQNLARYLKLHNFSCTLKRLKCYTNTIAMCDYSSSNNRKNLQYVSQADNNKNTTTNSNNNNSNDINNRNVRLRASLWSLRLSQQLAEIVLNIVVLHVNEAGPFGLNFWLESCYRDDYIKDHPVKPVDAFSWIVLLTAFISVTICTGVIGSLSVFYVEFLHAFSNSKAEIAIVHSLANGMYDIGGVLAGIMIDRIGCRASMVAGGLMTAVSIAVSFFAKSIYFLIFSLGTISDDVTTKYAKQLYGSQVEQTSVGYNTSPRNKRQLLKVGNNTERKMSLNMFVKEKMKEKYVFVGAGLAVGTAAAAMTVVVAVAMVTAAAVTAVATITAAAAANLF